jgi:hypothetical protein
MKLQAEGQSNVGLDTILFSSVDHAPPSVYGLDVLTYFDAKAQGIYHLVRHPETVQRVVPGHGEQIGQGLQVEAIVAQRHGHGQGRRVHLQVEMKASGVGFSPDRLISSGDFRDVVSTALTSVLPRAPIVAPAP